MDTTTTTPATVAAVGDFRCYVADLAAYNSGRMIGQWVALDGLDADEMRAAVQSVIDASPFPGAEEYAIHDWDGLPSSFGEWPDWDVVAAYVAAMEELGGAEEREAFRLWRENIGGDSLDVEEFRDAYCGCYDSGEAYAEELAYEIDAAGVDWGGQCAWPLGCIDWAAAWRELQLGGDNWGEHGEHGFHVFRGC